MRRVGGGDERTVLCIMTEANCCGWAWKEEKFYMFIPPWKGRRNFGSAAAPHQSVSRANTHGSNLAWEFAKAVCSCGENERIDSASRTPPPQNRIRLYEFERRPVSELEENQTATCFNYLSQAWSVLHNIDFQHLCIGHCNFSSQLMITQCSWPGKFEKENDRNWPQWREISRILKGCSIAGK